MKKEIWYSRRCERDQRAREEYFAGRNEKWRKGEIYMVWLIDEEIKADDPRIQ